MYHCSPKNNTTEIQHEYNKNFKLILTILLEENYYTIQAFLEEIHRSRNTTYFQNHFTLLLYDK